MRGQDHHVHKWTSSRTSLQMEKASRHVMVILESLMTRKIVADFVDKLIPSVVVRFMHLFFRKTKWLLRQLVVARLLIGGRETTRRASGNQPTRWGRGTRETSDCACASIKIHVSHC